MVTNRDSAPQLVVEVKGKDDADVRWATQFRRNLMAHASVPATPYFMLAVPTKFFLWTGPSRAPEAPPDYVVDSTSLLRPYTESVSSRSGYALEFAVGAWLNDLVHEIVPLTERDADWLKASGLLESIRNGIVSTQAQP